MGGKPCLQWLGFCRRGGIEPNGGAGPGCLGVIHKWRGDDAFGERRAGLTDRLARILFAYRFPGGETLHPALCTGPPRGKAMTLLRPGLLSCSDNSPPWRRATAEARLKPSPEPGWPRLCSSRTKRSIAREPPATGKTCPPSARVGPK